MMEQRERVLSLVNAAWTTQAIGVACEMGLPDRIAAGTRSSRALAEEADADPDATYRLLRALVALELCVEGPAGSFALAPGGEMLRSDSPDSVAAWALLSSRRLWPNWSGLAESVRTGRSTRSRAEFSDDFTFLNGNDRAAASFNAAMIAATRPVARAVAAELDWSGVTTLVDVGGGAGELAAAVLVAHPRLAGIVYDLDHAASAAKEHLTALGMAARCRFVSGSFFEEVPPGDALALKSVLHNWDDERCRHILRACARALLPGGRVILLERLLPERMGTGREDRDAVRSDLNMLVGCGGRERTQRQFRSLFHAAGLRLVAVTPITPHFSVLVAER